MEKIASSELHAINAITCLESLHDVVQWLLGWRTKTYTYLVVRGDACHSPRRGDVKSPEATADNEIYMRFQTTSDPRVGVLISSKSLM